MKYLLPIIIGIIILTLVISLNVFEPVTDKLEATCNEYGMIYVYREGENCLDKDNVLHPIYSECPKLRKSGLCEIRFISGDRK